MFMRPDRVLLSKTIDSKDAVTGVPVVEPTGARAVPRQLLLQCSNKLHPCNDTAQLHFHHPWRSGIYGVFWKESPCLALNSSKLNE